MLSGEGRDRQGNYWVGVVGGGGLKYSRVPLSSYP